MGRVIIAQRFGAGLPGVVTKRPLAAELALQETRWEMVEQLQETGRKMGSRLGVRGTMDVYSTRCEVLSLKVGCS